MRVEDPTLRPCTDHATTVADRYRLGPVLRRSPGCCAHRGYDDLLQRTVTVTLLAGRGPLVLPPRSWLDRGPEVAELFDAGEADDRLFLVTQHPAEPTLAETTPPGGLDAAQVRALGAAVADTLIPRHRHGSAHGGLGAGTVAWTPRGASLAEFGLLPWLERSGELPVTPPFPAPEHGTGAPHDPAGDVYALGRLLDELAPAHRSRRLGELLADMTAESPADRPTMEEVARRLSGAREPGRARAAVVRTAALAVAACSLVLLGVGVSAFAAGSAPSTPGATLATTAAAPGPAPLFAPPVEPSDTAGSSGTGSSDTGSSDSGSSDSDSTDGVVVAEPPGKDVPTTMRVESARSAETRAALRRDDGDDRPSTSTRSTTSTTPTTSSPRPTTSATPSSSASPKSTTSASPSSSASPTAAPTTSSAPDDSASPDDSSRPASKDRDLRDVLDRVTTGLGQRADSGGDGADHADRTRDRDLRRES